MNDKSNFERSEMVCTIEPKGNYDLGDDVSALLFEDTLVGGNGGESVTEKRAELWDYDGEFMTLMNGEHSHEQDVLRQVKDAWLAGHKAGTERGAKQARREMRQALGIE